MATETSVPQFGLEIRKEFMLRENGVFLNHGGYGSVPRCVYDRRIQYLDEMESNADVWFRYSMYKYLDAAVRKVAEFMGIAPKDTFLMQNVTKATNTVLKQFPLKSGDAILITNLTYKPVTITTNKAAAKVKGVNVYILNIPFPIHRTDDIVDLYEAFLTDHPDITLAVIDHITSPTSLVMPVKKLVTICHKHDVTTLVDAAHVPGQLKPDIQNIDADFYTGNLHKWLFCPRSCAFLWMNPFRKHNWLKPLVTSVFDDDTLSKAFSFEGTKDDTPYICVIDGIDYYNRIGGATTILEYTTILRKDGMAYLAERWGTQLLDVPDEMVAPNIQALYLPSIPYLRESKDDSSQHQMLQKLLTDKFDIQVVIQPFEVSLIVRVCVQVYNTMDDFVKLGNAVLTLCESKEPI